MFIRNLAEAYPKGIKLEGAIAIRIKLFCEKIDLMCGAGYSEQFKDAFQKLGNVTAQQGFEYPDGDIIDRVDDKIPGRYLLKRPDEAKAIFDELGRIYNRADKPGCFLTKYDLQEFEQLVLDIELEAWIIGRKARRLEI